MKPNCAQPERANSEFTNGELTQKEAQTLSEKRVNNLFENFSAKLHFPLNTSQFKRPEYVIGK